MVRNFYLDKYKLLLTFSVAVDLLSALFIEHGIVAVYVVMSGVHQRTYVNIKIHLPLVCPRNKFIDIFLHVVCYVIRVTMC